MVCDSWKEKLDTYIDNELSEAEMRMRRPPRPRLPRLLDGYPYTRTDEAHDSSRWKTLHSEH